MTCSRPARAERAVARLHSAASRGLAPKNMRRFYGLAVQRDLFGQWCLIRAWGRIGRAGRVRMVAYATAAQAREALTVQQRVKERRGYCVL
jgi:predicted DNA-binding WGR domain protein